MSINLNIGSGRIRQKDYISIDKVQIIDGNGNETVDVLLDIEKEKLPYEDSLVDNIIVDNVLEHLQELRFVMNECHRVLKIGGLLKGIVPVAGTDYDFRDPTHVRHFIKGTFQYLTGENRADDTKPSHPKYADYGYLPWNEISLTQDDKLIYFELTPRKV